MNTSSTVQPIEEICAAECRLPNGVTIITAVIYISSNQPVSKIIDFIHFVLLPYTIEDAALLKNDFGKMPIILSGDFNKNFKSEDTRPLIELFC